MWQYIRLTFLILFSFSVGQGLHWLKDGFNPRHLTGLDVPVEEEWPEEVQLVLQQPFSYLGRGTQCFAFVSQDGRYVLKFPRMDIYKTPLWVRAIGSASYRKALEEENGRRKAFVLNSFALAAFELKESTGLIASHVGKSSSKEKITLIDRMGRKTQLRIGETPFALQYKQPTLKMLLPVAIAEGRMDEAQKILDAWIQVALERSRKGILNKDGAFLRNCGFDGVHAYEIDLGSFYRSSELSLEQANKRAFREAAGGVQRWLRKRDLTMLKWFNEQLEALPEMH